MARDYEDFSSVDDLNDDELRELVRQRLNDHPDLDIDEIRVEAADGLVRLEGRVGTEIERRMADHVVTDLVGPDAFENELLVDALTRVETPMDVEDHLVQEATESGTYFGGMPEQQESTVVEARGDESLEERMFGTTNYQDAVAHGSTYIPPESPTPEGLSGTDADPGDYGEDH